MGMIHHATIKKADKLGFTLAVHDADASTVQLGWNGHTFYGIDPKQLVEDVTKFKMITAEYPKMRVAQDGREWVIRQAGIELAAAETLEDAFFAACDALQALDDEDDDEDDEELDEEFEQQADDEADDEADDGHSVVKSKYKQRYRPFNMTCGDDLAREIFGHVARENEDGEPRVNPKLLRKFAVANDCWDDRYALLNVGMQRMNIGNRLRSKVRKGHDIVWA